VAIQTFLLNLGDWTIDVEHEGRGMRGGRSLSGTASIKLKYAGTTHNKIQSLIKTKRKKVLLLF
jgi:hypothetical protein